jgi:lauroyl/myristoyl acyltransferase
MEVAGCKLLAKLIPKLSRRGCVGLGQLTGAIAYHIDSKGRRVALENITFALGESLNDSWRREIVRRSYQNFAVTMLSLFWSPRIDKGNAERWILASGFEEVIARAKDEGRGIVFVCAHQGNWEWGAVAFSLLGGQASIVAEDFKNCGLTDLFSRLRSRNMHRVIPQEKSVLRMLKAVLRGETTGLLGDLNVSPTGAAVAVDAFPEGGHALQMCVTRLHAVLAHRGNALIVPVLTFPLPDGRCRVVAQAPIEPEGCGERVLAQRTWDVFEKAIIERPDLWLWAYKHFRYRPHNTTREHPFYSRENAQFEEIRRESR